MIATMAREIAAALQARGYPVEVLYEGARLSSAVGVAGRQIAFARDRKTSETFGPFPGGNGNPRATGVRGLAVVVEIRAQSTRRGVLVAEHQADCDKLVDALYSELFDWCTAARAGAPQSIVGRMLGPDDFPAGDVPAGAVFRLQFHLPRGVFKRDYDGAAEPTGTLAGSGAVLSPVRVSRDGVVYEEVPPSGD